MAHLFSVEWMHELRDLWNDAPEVRDRLADLGFASVLCCGFKDEDHPRGTFVVQRGRCVRAGAWSASDPPAAWDLRADLKDWLGWVEYGVGLTGLGLALVTGKLKFKVYDWRLPILRPRLVAPLVKGLGLMRVIGADELP